MNVVREWQKILSPYKQAVEELKVKLKAIRNEYREMNEYSPIEFVTGRVKKVSSIIEKSKRRNIPEDQIEEIMEDIAGLRIMCQFTDDIYTVVDLLRKRDGKDLTIIYEKDYINNPKESGYKSYHVIIQYPVQTAFGEKKILVELQIRTLAMNFWATIEHSLNYKYQTNMPVDIQNRLKIAADAASKLDEEMTEIRQEIINAQKIFEEKSNTVRDIIDNIQELHAGGEEKKAFSFQKRFDRIFDYGDDDMLGDLLEELKGHLPRYQVLREKSE